jgi:hypothetical protein
VILDTDGNIFGGFTPVEWESPAFTPESDGKRKEDPSLKSFLFTLKNPHNVSARRFALKAENNYMTIYCDSENGPCFYGAIGVLNNSNANTDSYTKWFDDNYTNDTGRDGSTFFTGSLHFQVKEIEIFEITN